METLIQIGQLLLLLSASALCVYIIVTLVKLSKLMQVIQSEIVELNRSLKPILENINIVSEKLRIVASKIDDQVSMVHGVFVAFKRITDNIIRFEERLQQRLEEPLIRISSVFNKMLSKVFSFFTKSTEDIF